MKEALHILGLLIFTVALIPVMGLVVKIYWSLFVFGWGLL